MIKILSPTCVTREWSSWQYCKFVRRLVYDWNHVVLFVVVGTCTRWVNVRFSIAQNLNSWCLSFICTSRKVQPGFLTSTVYVSRCDTLAYFSLFVVSICVSYYLRILFCSCVTTRCSKKSAGKDTPGGKDFDPSLRPWELLQSSAPHRLQSDSWLTLLKVYTAKWEASDLSIP